MRLLLGKLCLVGLLALGAVSCGDSDDDDGGTQQQVTVPTPELGLTANLNATIEQDPLRVLLSWDYQGTEDVSFAVYRGETSTELAVQNLSAARLLATTDDVFYEDTNVAPGNTYYYRVRAFEGRDIGRASQLIAVTIAADGTGTVDVVEDEQPAPDDDGTPPPEMPEPPTEPTPKPPTMPTEPTSPTDVTATTLRLF
jgi:predicted phage tail protein